MSLHKDIIILICEDLAVWRKLRMTSKYMKALVGHHYEHYPNQVRFMIRIPNKTIFSIIGADIYNISFSIDDILYILEQIRVYNMELPFTNLILIDSVLKINNRFTIDKYISVNINYSDHDHRSMWIEFDHIWVCIDAGMRSLYVDNDGSLIIKARNPNIITFGHKLDNGILLDIEPIRENNSYASWRFFTAIVNQYSK